MPVHVVCIVAHGAHLSQNVKDTELQYCQYMHEYKYNQKIKYENDKRKMTKFIS